jgi:N6-adenosine-specific RNA methylase IME4
MIPLPSVSGGFKVIVADPATDFAAGKKGRPQHYPRMSDHEIAALPVRDIAAEDCHLFLWVTSPKLYRAPGSKILLTPQEIAAAWGFRFSGRAFVWVKTHAVLARAGDPMFVHKSSFHMGQGFTTRKNVEDVLLFKRGRPKRLSASIHEVIVAPRRQHSRKPDEFYERVERYADGPRLEMFARQSRPGWTTWGSEATYFDEAAE